MYSVRRGCYGPGLSFGSSKIQPQRQRKCRITLLSQPLTSSDLLVIDSISRNYWAQRKRPTRIQTQALVRETEELDLNCVAHIDSFARCIQAGVSTADPHLVRDVVNEVSSDYPYSPYILHSP